jgi:hypothetical protein
MEFEKKLTVYHYRLNIGFIESQYEFLENNRDDINNPLYKIVGNTHDTLPKYEKLKNFYLTKESIIHKQIESKRESIENIKSNLKREEDDLLELESFTKGKEVDFNSLEKYYLANNSFMT